MRATELVQEMRRVRDEAIGELARLSDDACRYPATWGDNDASVNVLLRVFAFHELDHVQHLAKLLRARGVNLGEAYVLLARAQALRAEVETMLLCLSDAELEATGPGEEDWSARQVAEHLLDNDRGRLAKLRRAIAAGQAADSSG